MSTTTSTVLPYEPIRDDAHAGTASRYTLLAMLCVVAAIAYVQRSAISVPQLEIGNDLRIDKAQFGIVFFAWNIGYALMQLPAGALGDRWGSRRALAFYAVLWSVATGLTALARDFYSIVVLWMLMGVAQAGVFPCAMRAIGRAFSLKRRASATGFLGASMGIGGALGQMLTGVLVTVLGWRWSLALYVLPGIAWAVLFFAMFYREAPGGPTAPPVRSNDGTAADPYAGESVWGRILLSQSAWLLCAQQFLRAAATIFFFTWFPTFLRESRGVSVVGSGMLTGMALAGGVLGSLVGGFVSDKVLALTGSRRLSRQGIAVVGMLACATLLTSAYFVADTTLAVAVISAGAFCGTFGGVSGYTVAIDLGGRRVATVFSMMNMWGNIGTALSPLFIGWLVKRTGNWDLVLFIFAGVFAVDAVCWMLLNPKGPLFPEGDRSEC